MHSINHLARLLERLQLGECLRMNCAHIFRHKIKKLRAVSFLFLFFYCLMPFPICGGTGNVSTISAFRGTIEAEEIDEEDELVALESLQARRFNFIRNHSPGRAIIGRLQKKSLTKAVDTDFEANAEGGIEDEVSEDDAIDE